MSGHNAPLPDELAGMIVLKLHMVYGKRFSGNFDASRDQLRAFWANELSGVSEAGVRYALAHLPLEHPPTVLTFRMIAVSRPDDPQPLSLPAPAQDRSQWSEAKREALAKLAQLAEEMRAKPKQGVDLSWCYRVLAPDSRSGSYARKMAREVLAKHGLPDPSEPAPGDGDHGEP